MFKPTVLTGLALKLADSITEQSRRRKTSDSQGSSTDFDHGFVIGFQQVHQSLHLKSGHRRQYRYRWAMIEELWETRVVKLPAWPCPSCKHGRLLLQGERPHHHETGQSAAARENTGDHDIYDARFAATLKCDSARCGNVVICIGEVHLQSSGYPLDDQFEQWCEYEIASTFPPPPIISIPTCTPAEIKLSIRAAFGLYWSDVEACGNKIRKCAEQVLTDRGVPKESKNDSLACRIKRFRGIGFIENTAGIYFDAIRHVGNSGSHEDNHGLNRTDILHCFEMLEDALSAIYGANDLSIKAAAIEAKHKV